MANQVSFNLTSDKKLASVYAVMPVTRLAVVIFFLAGIAAGKLWLIIVTVTCLGRINDFVIQWQA